MTVLLIGTLDTKGDEIAFVHRQLESAGLSVLVIDVGAQGLPTFDAGISRDQVFRAADTTVQDILEANDRGKAIEAAAHGVVKIVHNLQEKENIQGVLSLGGSAGTTIGTAAMRALPFGVPKVMVSTLASGQVRPYVGVRDICMIHSVVDISGLNRISRKVLTNAAQALIGMVKGDEPPAVDEKPLITASMFGVTTPCVDACRKQLEANDYEVLVFHATGIGGQTMEQFITDGLIQGVLDLTTTELADELVGGILSAGVNRLTAAAMKGTPQVISLGALDMVNFGAPDTVPAQFEGRRFYQHNPTVTLMRTTPDECDQLGKEIAHKASAAKGPTALLMPLKGVSAIDKEDQPFWWPEADAALFQSIRNWISPHVQVKELDLHINDPEFAEIAVQTLLEMIPSNIML